jgi:hypothetical protein
MENSNQGVSIVSNPYKHNLYHSKEKANAQVMSNTADYNNDSAALSPITNRIEGK